MQSFDEFNLKMDDKDDKKSSMNLSQCWFDGDGDHVGNQDRTRLVSFGTELPSEKKLSKWIDEDIRPIPIKFELTPIGIRSLP